MNGLDATALNTLKSLAWHIRVYVCLACFATVKKTVLLGCEAPRPRALSSSPCIAAGPPLTNCSGYPGPLPLPRVNAHLGPSRWLFPPPGRFYLHISPGQSLLTNSRLSSDVTSSRPSLTTPPTPSHPYPSHYLVFTSVHISLPQVTSSPACMCWAPH